MDNLQIEAREADTKVSTAWWLRQEAGEPA